MMCCKLPEIPELNKPLDLWCRNAKPGRGCGIYVDRPETCRAFACEWLTDLSLPESWKPDRSRFFVSRSGGWYIIQVDPGAPLAWKQPQFYPGIKTAAAKFAENGVFVLVRCGLKKFVIFPDRDEDVSHVADIRHLRVETLDGPNGLEFAVRVAPATV